MTSKERLSSFISRIEKLEEQKADISSDIGDIYQEAKSEGFDVKAMKEVVKLRKKDASEVAQQEAIVDTYRAALGMLPTTGS